MFLAACCVHVTQRCNAYMSRKWVTSNAICVSNLRGGNKVVRVEAKAMEADGRLTCTASDHSRRSPEGSRCHLPQQTPELTDFSARLFADTLIFARP